MVILCKLKEALLIKLLKKQLIREKFDFNFFPD
jgi:hypothetical protein